MKVLCLPPQTPRAGRRSSEPGAQPGSCDSGMGEVVPALWVQWAVLMLAAGFNTCKDGMM